MRSVRIVAALFAVGVLAAVCGGGDGGDTSKGGASDDADQTARIESCLADAGIEVKANDTQAFGVDDPYDRLTISHLKSDAFDEEYGANLYVFSNAQAAEDNRPAIALQSVDDERNRIIDNVLVYYNIVPDKADARSVEACVQ